MNEINTIQSSPVRDHDARRLINVSPQKPELVVLLNGKYEVSQVESTSLDRTGLLRIADACEFLSNNLPPNALGRG